MPPFAHQVAGHPSSIQTLDSAGATLIKPATTRELDFYTSLGPSLSLVGEWTPSFFGTLRLEGRLSSPTAELGAGGVLEAVEGVGKEMLVLENLTFRFGRPNVLDVKLGTQLWDEDSSEEKQERMDKVSRATTSGSTGVRLTGFQVWDPEAQDYIITPKTYGKSIPPSELPIGFSKFFLPLVNRHSSLLPHLLKGILKKLVMLIHIWESLEVRMRGGSLLLVVEGDEDKLRAAMERKYLLPPGDESSPTAPSPPSNQAPYSPSQARSKEATDNDESDDDKGEEGRNSDDESEASSTDEDGSPLASSLRAFELRLIDFAHFSATPNEGKDEGVLLGLKTVEGLVRGLLEKCEEDSAFKG